MNMFAKDIQNVVYIIRIRFRLYYSANSAQQNSIYYRKQVGGGLHCIVKYNNASLSGLQREVEF